MEDLIHPQKEENLNEITNSNEVTNSNEEEIRSSFVEINSISNNSTNGQSK